MRLLRARSYPGSLAAIVLYLLLSGCNRSGLNPGDNAPPLELYTLDGKPASLSDFKGKVVLLNFWATWCVPCVQELPALEILYGKLKDRGFEIVAVGVDDDPLALKEFARRFGLSFPIFYDKSGAAKGKYKMTGVPESFIIDRDGKMVLFQDFPDNMPVVRIVGPREWSSPVGLSRITDLLN